MIINEDNLCILIFKEYYPVISLIRIHFVEEICIRMLSTPAWSKVTGVSYGESKYFKYKEWPLIGEASYITATKPGTWTEKLSFHRNDIM